MVVFVSLFHVFLFDYSLKSGVAKAFMLYHQEMEDEPVINYTLSTATQKLKRNNHRTVLTPHDGLK